MALRIHPPYMENEIVPSDTSTDEEIVAPEVNEPEPGLPADPVEVEPKDEEEADKEALKQKNQDLYEQLKKAKGFVRDKDGKWVKKETLQVPKKEETQLAGMTNEELFSCVKAGVQDDDMTEVKTYARSHGITMTEALKKAEVKAILKVRQEYRQTAEAANTGGSRRGSSKLSDDQLLANASQRGEMPDSDEDMVRLIKARREQNKKK